MCKENNKIKNIKEYKFLHEDPNIFIKKAMLLIWGSFCLGFIGVPLIMLFAVL